jgi:steroid delta-isomerase-like uncharacterized protein
MEETKNLIEQYYAAFNHQDMEAFLNCLSDDVIHDLNQGERQIGKEKFIQFMNHMNHCYKEQVKELAIMVNDLGTRAAAEFIIEGVYHKTDGGLPKAKGQKYQLAVGAFFSIKKGKIARVTVYYNLQDWLKQVK